MKCMTKYTQISSPLGYDPPSHDSPITPATTDHEGPFWSLLAPPRVVIIYNLNLNLNLNCTTRPKSRWREPSTNIFGKSAKAHASLKC